MGVHHGRLPQEFTAGVYHGRLLRNIEGASLFVLGYHWLPLTTTDLVGDNREFKV